MHHLYYRLRNLIVCLSVCDSVTSNSLSVRDSEQGADEGGPEASNFRMSYALSELESKLNITEILQGQSLNSCSLYEKCVSILNLHNSCTS